MSLTKFLIFLIIAISSCLICQTTSNNLCSVTGGMIDLNREDLENEYQPSFYWNLTCTHPNRNHYIHLHPLLQLRTEKCYQIQFDTKCANVPRQEVFLYRPRKSEKPWQLGVRTVYDCQCMYVEKKKA